MAQPPNGTPGIPQGVPGEDYVDMPGVAPITPASFPQGSPPNPGPQQPITLAPVQVNGQIPRPPIQLPEQQISGVIPPAKKLAPAVPGAIPGQPPVNPFGASPLDARQGVAADANVFADMADYYRKSASAVAEGKLDEAQRHTLFAQDQEKSLGESKALWNQALADQAAREKHMDTAIARGRQMSIDPDNYWNKKGTASNILAAISVGLGSFASGMTHGATGNPALTMVNNAIDRDIASQKDNIENYWKSVVQQGHIDDNAFNKALTTQNMMGNMRLAGMKVYESDLRAIQAKTDSQVVKLGAQKQIDDLQLAMNGERKALGANLAAQAAAGAAQINKDSESFNKDVMDYMKEHPGMDPQSAAKDVAAINPARTARLGSRSALPADVQSDFIYGKETGYAGAFNSTVSQVAQQNIKDYEKKTGHAASAEDRAAILQQTSQVLLKQHPEFGKFQFFRPGSNGGLVDVRPAPADKGTGGGADRRSKEQIAKDAEREVYVDQPVLGPNGQPIMGVDGKPQMQKVKQLATTKETGENYIKWSNMEPTVKKQIADLKQAWQEGNVGKYEAIRGALIEKLPEMYGFSRGPSSAQVEHTFKDLIPDYQHWYTPSITASPLGQGRDSYMNDKLKVLEGEIDGISNDVRTNAFGPQAGAGGRSVGSYGQPAAPGAAGSAIPPAVSNGMPLPGQLAKIPPGARVQVIDGVQYYTDPTTHSIHRVPEATPEEAQEAINKRYNFEPRK